MDLIVPVPDERPATALIVALNAAGLKHQISAALHDYVEFQLFFEFQYVTVTAAPKDAKRPYTIRTYGRQPKVDLLPTRQNLDEVMAQLRKYGPTLARR